MTIQRRQLVKIVIIGMTLLFGTHAGAFEAALQLLSGQRASVTPYALESADPEAIARHLQGNRNRWAKHVKREHLGLEIWIAEGTWKSPESAFGHAMLRLIDNDEDAFNDTVVTFSMLPLDSRKTYEHAFGGFPIIPNVQTLIESLVTYLRLEGRPLRRFILPADAPLLMGVKRALSQSIEAPQVLGTYHFVQNNCFSGLLKVLKAGGYPLPQHSLLQIPANAPNTLTFNFMNFYPKTPHLRVEGAARVIEALQAKFGDSRAKVWFESWRKGEDTSLEFLHRAEFWAGIESLSDPEIELLLHFWPLDWNSHASRIRDLHARRIQHPRNLREILSLKAFPKSLYRLCSTDDVACRSERSLELRNNWSAASIAKHLRRVHQVYQEDAERRQHLADPQIRLAQLQHRVIFDLLQLIRDETL